MAYKLYIFVAITYLTSGKSNHTNLYFSPPTAYHTNRCNSH